MKKIIALVLVLSFTATMVFAEPVVKAVQIIQSTDSINETPADTLFADIGASQLRSSEVEAVEGDGILLAPWGASTGFVLATAAITSHCAKNNIPTTPALVAVTSIAAVGGAIMGFAIALAIPGF